MITFSFSLTLFKNDKYGKILKLVVFPDITEQIYPKYKLKTTCIHC